jgi:hypothetical protein
MSDTYDFGACVLQVREIDRLRARVAVLEAALREACDGFEYCSQYKGEYLAEKHGDAEDIARLRLAIAAQPAATGEKSHTVCIGWTTIRRLATEGMVYFDDVGVGLVAADDLFHADIPAQPAATGEGA